MARLVASIPAQTGLTNIGYGIANKLQGRSGVRHQLDVSFIDGGATPPKLVAVECKYLGRRVKLEHVKVLYATLDDLRGSAGLPNEAVQKPVFRERAVRGRRSAMSISSLRRSIEAFASSGTALLPRDLYPPYP